MDPYRKSKFVIFRKPSKPEWLDLTNKKTEASI
jgi:hypothetical protein